MNKSMRFSIRRHSDRFHEMVEGIGGRILRSRGVTEIPDGLTDQIQMMTVLESSRLFIRTFGISGTAESVAGEMNALMDRHTEKIFL